jgi:hypothetical protein
MPDRSRRADAFPTISGLLGIATGPVLLATGAPAGWSFLLIAAGVVLLAAQWTIAHDIALDLTGRMQVVAALIGIACVAVAVVYLTRAADDLPSLFPGHDADSEHFRVLPGVLTLAVGLVVLGRGVATALPARASR